MEYKKVAPNGQFGPQFVIEIFLLSTELSFV